MKKEIKTMVSKWYEECVYETITKGKAIKYESEITSYITKLEGKLDRIKEVVGQWDNFGYVFKKIEKYNKIEQIIEEVE